MRNVKYNVYIDKLEITYQDSQHVRDALAAIKKSKVMNEITVMRVDKHKHYQHELSAEVELHQSIALNWSCSQQRGPQFREFEDNCLFTGG